MNKTNEKTTEALQDLLTRSYDAEQGFEHAADAVGHDGLAQLLREYSVQRRKFGRDIKALMKSSGAEPETGASVMGKLHQFWIDLRGLLSDGREDEILAECLRGEEKTMEDYRDYLHEDGLTPESYALVVEQLAEIEQIYQRLRNLEKAAEVMNATEAAAM